MRKKSVIKRKKVQSIIWIAGCLLFLLSLVYTPLNAQARTTQKATSQLSRLYVPSEDVRSSERQKISINAENEPLLSVLKRVADKVSVGISYQEGLIPEKSITVHIEDTPVFQTLEEVLKGTGLKVVLPFSRDVLVIKKKPLQAKIKKAQLQTGTITGVVTDAATGEPLPGVNILITDLTEARGAATDEEGRYTIEDVPVGDHTLRAQFIGYKTETKQVTVIDGQSITVNFELSSATLEMEQLVVTGAGVVAQKKQLGQSIAVIGAEELETSPVSSIAEALQGRVPGVVAGSSGELGSSAAIRIRGTVSLTQRNGPLIYIDGVRVSSGRGGFVAYNTSMLSQINAENIARIQVLKGAAAATLYGTEASSGVILITTKKGIGRDDPVEWSFHTEQSISKYPLGRIPPNVAYSTKKDKIISNQPAQHYIDLGYLQSYNLSVTGGMDKFGYFASVWYENANGGLPTNSLNNMGVRLNMTMRPLEGMRVRIGLNSIHNKVRVPYPAWGVMGEFVLADPLIAGPGQPYGELYHSIKGVLAYENYQTTNRSTFSLEINHQFSEAINANFLFGYHKRDQRSQIFVPPGPDQANPKGFREVTNAQGTEITLSTTVTWNAQLSSSLSSDLSVGAQGYWKKHRTAFSAVKNYPGPAVTTLRGGTIITGLDEFYKEVVSIGVFAQEKVGINERLFLTGGLRVDGNSTFGENFGFALYPHVGLSWIISNAPFWGIELFDMLRLRAAYGTSGLQPGVYDALRTWQIMSLLGGQPALIPNSYGNKNLKPERSREIEIGANMAFLDNRLQIDLTYFWQRTSDAIMSRERAPSAGYLAPQLVNIGGLKSHGIEVRAEWVAINQSNLRLSFFGTFATRKQVITEMGGIPPFKIGSGRKWNYFKEGYQPGAVIAPVLNPDDPYHLTVPVSQLTSLDQVVPNILLAEDGSFDIKFLGNQLPTILGSFGITLNLPEYNLSFSTLLRGAGGFVMYNSTRQVRVGNKIAPMTARMIRDLKDPNTSTERRREIAKKYAHNHPQMVQGFVSDGDYLRLQKVSVSWMLPAEVASMLSIESARVTLAGHNLFLITPYDGMMDPGTTGGGTDFTANVDRFGAPNPRIFQLAINVKF